MAIIGDLVTRQIVDKKVTGDLITDLTIILSLLSFDHYLLELRSHKRDTHKINLRVMASATVYQIVLYSDASANRSVPQALTIPASIRKESVVHPRAFSNSAEVQVNVLMLEVG
ncbi:hypothetical protein TNCV_1877391 [Trichonephila clavipes]|nr:hypothetical protein TNCV_1877391 [Trichonephila clavipes]